MRVGAVLNYLPVDSGSQRLERAFAEAVRDQGGLLLNDPRHRPLLAKADLHLELLRADLEVPRTLIWRRRQPSRDLTDEERSFVGARMVCKPSRGGGGRGVVLPFEGSREALEQARSYDPTDDYLVQEVVEPATIAGRKAWFRVYFCLGQSFPLFWWSPRGSASQTLTREHIDGAHMSPVEPEIVGRETYESLEQVTATIARVAGACWFSCEIVAVERSYGLAMVPIDYVNDICYARTRLEVGAKGLPESTAEAIATHLVDSVARLS